MYCGSKFKNTIKTSTELDPLKFDWNVHFFKQEINDIKIWLETIQFYQQFQVVFLHTHMQYTFVLVISAICARQKPPLL